MVRVGVYWFALATMTSMPFPASTSSARKRGRGKPVRIGAEEERPANVLLYPGITDRLADCEHMRFV